MAGNIRALGAYLRDTCGAATRRGVQPGRPTAMASPASAVEARMTARSAFQDMHRECLTATGQERCRLSRRPTDFAVA